MLTAREIDALQQCSFANVAADDSVRVPNGAMGALANQIADVRGEFDRYSIVTLKPDALRLLARLRS